MRNSLENWKKYPVIQKKLWLQLKLCKIQILTLLQCLLLERNTTLISPKRLQDQKHEPTKINRDKQDYSKTKYRYGC